LCNASAYKVHPRLRKYMHAESFNPLSTLILAIEMQLFIGVTRLCCCCGLGFCFPELNLIQNLPKCVFCSSTAALSSFSLPSPARSISHAPQRPVTVSHAGSDFHYCPAPCCIFFIDLLGRATNVQTTWRPSWALLPRTPCEL
jgi:hypothetical protein